MRRRYRRGRTVIRGDRGIDSEKQLRRTVAKLRQTVADQNAEIRELRQRVTRLTLAAAVLTHDRGRREAPAGDPGNVFPLRPPAT
ncbi:hypothetical protein [Streptomyces sp. NPDC053427]|uniref:hypothetical protein n=1 Tax=Streptomyces sp. NPDC053427 TaxID=3365701 RepID=UPI0037CFFCF3